MTGWSMMRALRLTLVTAGLAAAGLAAGACSPRPAAPQIGVNLLWVTSDADSIPFVDVFRMSSPWIAISGGAGSTPAPLALDKNGWISSLAPGQAGLARVFTNGSGRYPGGLYTLLYDGDGMLDIRSAAARVVARQPGQISIAVTPLPGPRGVIEVVERATDPGNPIRNIRLILPGFRDTYQTAPFNPVFLARLRPFHTLRFKDWEVTSRSDVASWADRRPPDYETQALASCCSPHGMSGVALEYQIDLANTLNAEPWFSLETRASDDFVRRMAALVHSRLKPGLKVYIEYGNELWNPYFGKDVDYIQKAGLEGGLANDPVTAGSYYYLQRSAEMFDIWTREFRDQPARIVRVIESRQNDPGFDETELSYLSRRGAKADVLAIGAYVSPGTLMSWRPVNTTFYDAILSMTPAQIAAVMDDQIAQMKPLFERHAAIATKHGVELAAYEGGEGLATNMMDPGLRPRYQARVAAAFTAANRDPGMAKVYRDLFDAWFGSGGKLFMHFADVEEPNPFGDFGLLEYQNQDPSKSVKYGAVIDYMNANAGKP